MRYVVFQSGGKQYKASEGDELLLERLAQPKDQAFEFSEVLLYVNGDSRLLGKPFVSDVTIKALSLGDEKGEKIRVAKFKSKVRYRKVMGHRQHLTRVKIQEIAVKGEKRQEVPKEAVKVKEEKQVKPVRAKKVVKA